MTADRGYSKPRRQRVVIAGNYGFGNLGDESILSGIASVLRAARPDVELLVVSGDPSTTTDLHGIPACPWGDLHALGSAIDDSDAVILGGGGLFHDYRSFDPAHIATDDQRHLARYFRIVALATAVGRPLGFLALGVGPFRSATSRHHTRLAFDQAWLSTVRDSGSIAELAAIGVDVSRVTVAPDPAFTIPLASDAEVADVRDRYSRGEGRPLVAVAVRPWPFGPPAEQWIGALARSLDEFLAEHDGTAVFLAFQSKTSGDRNVARAVRSQMCNADRTQLADDVVTPRDLFAHVSAADLTIGMRLHSLIFAVRAGVPAVALSYDPKVSGLLADTGHAGACVGLGEADDRHLPALIAEVWHDRAANRSALLDDRERRRIEAHEGIARFTELLSPRRSPRSSRTPEVDTLVANVARRRWSGETAAVRSSPPNAGLEPPGPADVVCFSIIRWEFRWQRPQQLMSLWGKRGRRVFYVRMADFVQPGGQPISVTRLAVNVWEVRIALPGSFSVYSGVHPEGFVDAGLDALQALCDRFAIVAALGVVQVAGWAPLAMAARERFGWTLLYDCMDDWSTFPGMDRKPALSLWESRLAEAADLVAVSSHTLQERWSVRRPDALLVPNAADVEFFQTAPGEDPLPEVHGPIAGFVGAIAEWFDRDLVASVARACPDITFVLVGGVHRVSVHELERLPNVRFEGAQQYDRMPAYLRRFDACLLPFVVGPVTHSVDPVKLHEYLSQGKPVVATRFAEILHYDDLLYVAADAQEFADHLRSALHEDDPALRARREEYASHNTWDARIDRIELALSEHQRPGPTRAAARSDPAEPDPAAPVRQVEALRAELRAAQAEIARMRSSRVWRLASRYWRARHLAREGARRWLGRVDRR